MDAGSGGTGGSAGVASLWGANIAALFPIIEVTLKGESLQSWNERRADDARARLAARRNARRGGVWLSLSWTDAMAHERMGL